MKKILLIILLLVGTLQTFSQQDPQYSLYMFNPLGVNPGYAGSREVLSAVLVHRSQWIGLEGAPETQALAINTPLKNKKMGVGLQIVNDKIGPKTVQTFTLAYAYRLKLGRGKLAFGLRGGILNYNYDWNKIEYKDEDDVIPNTAAESFMLPTVDFGIYYNTRTMYFGIALDHINRAQFNLIEGQDSINSAARVYSNFTATFGKAFVISDNLIIKTSLITRLAQGAGNIDINSSVLFKNKILFGVTLRTSGALVFMTEINLSKNLRMGIAYDVDASKIARSTSGSFEVFVGYDVGLFKSKVVSPRYF
ncbi:MAG: type IX secretion system membrane protein PorP/SprF [Flavobacteriales bacterium]|nr:type IX secretion system membrane protein PorP/SprF [Flavobacteriales bacterium]